MALTKLNFSGSGLSSLPNGSVIQTVTSTKTDSFTDSNQTNFVDIPNLAVTITPSSTANEVLIMYRVAVGIINGGYVAYIRLVRGSTNIAQGTVTVCITLPLGKELKPLPLKFNFVNAIIYPILYPSHQHSLSGDVFPITAVEALIYTKASI